LTIACRLRSTAPEWPSEPGPDEFLVLANGAVLWANSSLLSAAAVAGRSRPKRWCRRSAPQTPCYEIRRRRAIGRRAPTAGGPWRGCGEGARAGRADRRRLRRANVGFSGRRTRARCPWPSLRARRASAGPQRGRSVTADHDG